MRLSMESTRIEGEAADWLARRESGSWSEADARAFEEWQNQSTAHRIAVIRLEVAWQKADRLQALGAGVPSGQIPLPGSWRLSPESCRSAPAATRLHRFIGRRRVRDFEASSGFQPRTTHQNDGSSLFRDARPAKSAPAARRPRAWAAVVMLGLSGAIACYFIAYGRNTYQSTIGQIRVVSLPDGSTVTLNTNSLIHVSYSRAERLVDLKRGEAFFEDVRDPGRPFIVSAAGQRIVAVGTKFDVFRGTMDTRVVVTNGQVNVEYGKGGEAVGPTTELSAGSVAQVGPGAVLVKHVSLGEAQDYIAWRSGYLRFHDTDLAVAVAELNRYNQRQLVIADPAIASLKIAGNVRATNVDAFVQALQEGFPVRATNQGAEIVLTRRSGR